MSCAVVAVICVHAPVLGSMTGSAPHDATGGGGGENGGGGGENGGGGGGGPNGLDGGGGGVGPAGLDPACAQVPG